VALPPPIFPSTPPFMGSRRGGRLALRVVLTLLAILLVYLAGAGVWAHMVTPRVVMLASTPRVLDLRSLPNGVTDVLLPVEDPTFREHRGIDPLAAGQGRSTISTEVVRMLYIRRYDLPGIAGGFQRVFRLVNKVAGPVDLAPDVIAVVINRRLGKTLQLKLYLQHVYMGKHRGQQVYGFPAAARAYFGKDARQLSRRETVTLVAMMAAPNRFHPVNKPAALGERVRRIEKLLRGGCKPDGMRDLEYARCATASR
jgi:hypothetical protein